MTPPLEDIWTQFATRLLFFIRGRVADASAAEDILQDVFLKLQQRLGQLRGAEKLESWIYQITRNAIVDHYRQARPLEQLPEETAATGIPPGVGEAPDAEALLAAFRRMITQLPDTYREAIELTELQGLSQQELAQRLGISLSGAKSRVQRGRALLKEMLLECCRFEFDRRGGILACEPRRKAECAKCEKSDARALTVRKGPVNDSDQSAHGKSESGFRSQSIRGPSSVSKAATTV